MSRNSFQVSTFDRELTSNYARYQCTSDTIRKTLKTLGMTRDSGGEISGIVEFSAGNDDALPGDGYFKFS